MKKITLNLRSLAAIVALTAVLAGTSALAAGGVIQKTITANYMGIRLIVDGKEVVPTDANGNVVEPFIADGTTYLPVRAVGAAFGKEVNWDGANRIVYIGQVPGTADSWMKLLPPYQVSKYSAIYDGSDPKESFSVAGNEYTEGVFLWRRYDFEEPAFAIWNTNAQYASMTFTIGRCGTNSSNNNNAKLEVYLDGTYSTEYDLKWDAGPQTLTIPLNYAANVKLNLDGYSIRNDGTEGEATAAFAMYGISFN